MAGSVSLPSGKSKKPIIHEILLRTVERGSTDFLVLLKQATENQSVLAQNLPFTTQALFSMISCLLV